MALQDEEMSPVDTEVAEVHSNPDVELPQRTRKLPARFASFQLSALSSVRRSRRNSSPDEPRMVHFAPSPSPPPPPPPMPNPQSEHSESEEEQIPAVYYWTPTNDYGVYRIFENAKPSFDAEEAVSFEDLCNVDSADADPDPAPSFGPYANETIQNLMIWYQGCSGISLDQLDRLVSDVLLQKSYNSADLKGFSAQREASRIDETGYRRPFDPSQDLPKEDGWTAKSIEIPIPHPRTKCSEDSAPTYSFEVYMRSPVDVIRNLAKDPNFLRWTLRSHKLFWEPSDDRPLQRIYNESYTSDRSLAQQRLADKISSGSNHETVTIDVHWYSDGTLLANNTGDASITPGYLSIGNLTKYERLKLSSNSFHQFVYFPTIDDAFKDWYRKKFNSRPSKALLAYLKRELVQATWGVIMDEQFEEMFIDGKLMECYDKIIRHFFLKFHIYTADYLEKIMLAGIKFLGNYPCVLCLIKRAHICHLGTKLDTKRRESQPRVDSETHRNRIENARKFIFDQGYSVSSDHVKNALGHSSYLPVRNMFSQLFGNIGENYFDIFCPEIMHDVESGEWQRLLEHFIRILKAQKDKDALDIFDER
ncbi:hypothetical protein VKT23_019314 [Stygiomarasmius scandens]|uniref:Uncharacterized protein n=1 Tax=Marasmiellus scandens TaxID=2682957 RepID=A0ABR1ILR0_9AGAR